MAAVPEPEVKIALATQASHHAWHAALWGERLPTLHDVDGVCSTAILVRVLRRLGAQVDFYVPSRLEDGYGLSLRTVERAVAQQASVECLLAEAGGLLG